MPNPRTRQRGSAPGSLACYLIRYGAARDGRVRFAQGAATGRPSQLEVQVQGDDVQLLGRAVVVAEGSFKGLRRRWEVRGGA